MVTQAQQDQFTSTYAPYAKQAGAKLGVDGSVILGQWAQETGWGTNRGATQLNNLGGVNVAGGTGQNYASYSNPQDFTNSYVSMIQRKYPQATNTGSDANAFVTGLSKGTDGKSYFTDPISIYQGNISSISSSLTSNTNYQTASPSNQPPGQYRAYDANGMPIIGSTTDPTQFPIPGATRYEPIPTGAGSGITGTSTGAGTGTGSTSTGAGAGAGTTGAGADMTSGSRTNADATGATDTVGKAATTAPNVPAGAPPAPSVNGLKDMLQKWLQPNPLNDYWHPAYHFRLLMAGDKDLLEQAGASTIASLLQKVNGNEINQVIIAESGVTGYNIKDVEIITTDSMNAHTRQQQATAITMTVTEPMGISFLDALAGAGSLLGVWDYTKMTYFLQLSFTGYNENGSFANNPIPFKGFQNGGQWLYALTIDTIDTKLNEGGGIYTIHFITTDGNSLVSEDRAFKVTQVVAPEGYTVGELFDDYCTKLNAAWADEYGKAANGQPLQKFFIKTNPVMFKGDQYYGQNPATFKLVPQKPDKNPRRSLAMKNNANGKPVVSVTPGMNINDFISAAIMSTEEGQRLFKDENVVGQPDMSTTQTNAQRFRVSKMFSIEPDVKPIYHEKETGRYVREVTMNVTPTYYNGSLLSRPQINDADDPQVQRQMVQSLGDNGFLRKKYEYIFTSMNTEVLDFDLSFNFSFQAALPKAAGFRMNHLNDANHNRQKDPDPPVASETLIFNDFKTGSSTMSPQSTAIKAPAVPQSMPFDIGFFSNTMDLEPMTGPVTPTKPSVALPLPSNGGQKIYIEDVLSRLNQGQTNILPVSFTHGYLEEMNETVPGVNGQYHPDRPLAATIMMQRLSNNFQDITLTIRGDPYWLGQTNLERQILHRSGSGQTHDPEALPNFITGSPNIIIYFKYPLQMGDEFVPILKDSAAFNGIYQVTEVKHTFSEGAFKQVLTATRSVLIDLTEALSTDANSKSNDQTSSSAVSENNNADSTASKGNNVPGTGGSAIAPSGGPPNSQTQRDRAQESYNFWTTQKGYSPAAASGMVAQEEAESGFDWSRGTVAKGAFQWQAPRQKAILAGTGIDVTNPNTTHQQQLEAAYWEQTKGGEVSAGNKIRAATSGGQAGDIGSRYYERPAARDVQAQVRAGRGQYWQNFFTSTPS